MSRPAVLRFEPFFAYLAALVITIFASASPAHEMRPSVADLTVRDGMVQVQVRTNLEALLAEISPEHGSTTESENADAYTALRKTEPESLRQAFDAFEQEFEAGLGLEADGTPVPMSVVQVEIPEVGDVQIIRSTRITATAPLPGGTEVLTFAWADRFGALVLRALNDQGEGYATMLTGGTPSAPIEVAAIAPRSFFQVAMGTIPAGYQHVLGFDVFQPVSLFGLEAQIPLGFDHILFAVAMFLLVALLGPVLWQVLALVLGHGVALGMVAMGYAIVPSALIEPLIAAGLIYIALENVVVGSLTPWRVLVVFCVGVLHVLGFASGLEGLGASGAQTLPSMVGFHVGLDLGLLAIIAGCFVVLGVFLGRRTWYRAAVVVPGSLIIAAVGAFWFYERTML